MTAATEQETTILGVRLPNDLREKIKEAAIAEHRTESGFARFHLAAAVETLSVARPADDDGPPPQSASRSKPGACDGSRYFRRPSGIWRVDPDGSAWCRRLDLVEWWPAVLCMADLIMLDAVEVSREEGES